MKKYVKPELFYEHFELSQQIAACNYDLHPNSNATEAPVCTFIGDETTMTPGKTIFLQANISCDVKTQVYCEHSGSDIGFNTFNS